ncbi:32906_t:CDS:2 [Gigaspora margarita]|uniref:32906_t:CDS:1 n=1 Tax=Gigaspora margarita TaxID=4874 RepID=A0ABN7VIH6_GIGMA|nr:32906_t:CDS:2 [Gigaspora margarita]
MLIKEDEYDEKKMKNELDNRLAEIMSPVKEIIENLVSTAEYERSNEIIRDPLMYDCGNKLIDDRNRRCFEVNKNDDDGKYFECDLRKSDEDKVVCSSKLSVE